jgi:hypothetical protein
VVPFFLCVVLAVEEAFGASTFGGGFKTLPSLSKIGVVCGTVLIMASSSGEQYRLPRRHSKPLNLKPFGANVLTLMISIPYSDQSEG